MFDKLRLWFIGKLLKEKDGYAYIGTHENEPMGFFYDSRIKKYVLGQRSGNFYYMYPGISGWTAYRSKHLGEEKNKQISTVPFQKWIYGILENVYKDHMETIFKLTPESLSAQQNIFNKSVIESDIKVS